jgi:hypothetical protein
MAVAILELGDSKLASSREISSFSAILRSRDYLLDVGSNTLVDYENLILVTHIIMKHQTFRVQELYYCIVQEFHI